MSAQAEDFNIAFREARIPPLYFRERLTDMDYAAEVLTYVQHDMEEGVTEGMGVWLDSDDYTKADKTIHALAKSAVVREFDVITLTVMDLIAEINAEETDLFHMEVIVLPDLDNRHYAENPLPPYQKYAVEETITRLLKLEKAVFVNLSFETTWWSANMINLLSSRTRRFVV